MHLANLHYFPLSLPFFFILVALFVVVLILVQLRILRYAYTAIGIDKRYLLILLLLSLLGSYINIPVVQLPAEQVLTGKEIIFFGMHYIVPFVQDWPGTMVAVNVGGAVIPSILSLYLLIENKLYIQGFWGVLIVAIVCHLLSHPVPGLGIAEPVFVPPIITTIAALSLSRQHAAPLAYISGSLGTLIGADLLNLGKIRGLGAPIVSIGGAGTYDGIFVTGILAVILASFAGVLRKA
jgi:uncharacterized membrane protein